MAVCFTKSSVRTISTTRVIQFFVLASGETKKSLHSELLRSKIVLNTPLQMGARELTDSSLIDRQVPYRGERFHQSLKACAGGAATDPGVTPDAAGGLALMARIYRERASRGGRANGAEQFLRFVDGTARKGGGGDTHLA